MIGMIVARDLNGLIGYDGQIPWRKPADMKRFKKVTAESIVVMGRKTFDSIPLTKSGNMMPDRIIIVVTRDEKAREEHRVGSRPEAYSRPDLITNSVAHALEPSSTYTKWIIGGAEIYTEALRLKLVDFIDLTVVNQETPIEDPSKAVYLPELPSMVLESEEINPDDPMLTHYRYIVR